jgi:hypothetical protein
MKMLYGLIVLTCVPLPLARNGAAYPQEKVAEFLVEKLDITPFPPEIQPKPETRKEDIWRLWVCDAEVGRKGSTRRGATWGSADCDQGLGTNRAWNLRLRRCSGPEYPQRPYPANASARAERCKCTSAEPGVLEGTRWMPGYWWRRHQFAILTGGSIILAWQCQLGGADLAWVAS